MGNLIMSIVEKAYLDFYEGGRDGVVGRFGELITDRLKEISYIESLGLAKHLDIVEEVFKDIVCGNYEEINSKLIQDLQARLDFDVMDGLGKPKYSSDEKKDLIRRMEKSLGYESKGLETDEEINLFLLTNAIREL